MDRRKNPRHNIQLRLRFVVRRFGNQWLAGKTVNMSRSGALVETEVAVSLEVGDEIEMEMELAPTGGSVGRCLCCCGSVVRVVAETAAIRFAIGIETMFFRQTSLSDPAQDAGPLAHMVM